MRLVVAITFSFSHATTNTSIEKDESRIQTPEEHDTAKPSSIHGSSKVYIIQTETNLIPFPDRQKIF